jgi:hypothetical protein
MGWGGHVACMDRKRNAYMVLVAKSERNRSHERFRCRLEGMIKMDHEEILWMSMDRFILLGGETSRKLCEHGTKPVGSIKCG